MTRAILYQTRGTVTSFDDAEFEADLTDVDTGSARTGCVFPLDDLSKADRKLLAVGALLEAVAYRETAAGGQVRRVSEVRIAHGVHDRIQPASGRLLAATPVKSPPDMDWELAEDEREF